MELKQLEEEMKQRKERIEQWRKQRELEEAERAAATSPSKANEIEMEEEPASATVNDNDNDMEIDEEVTSKGAGLLTRGDSAVMSGAESSDEVDPLDAFMAGVTAEVRVLLKKKETSVTTTNNNNSKRTVSQKQAVTTKATNESEGIPVSEEPVAGNEDIDEEAEEVGEVEKKEDDFDLNDPAHLLALAMKKTKKKDVVSVDHSTVTYKPFRKDFYQETQEIAKLTAEQTEELRKELDGIRVRGKNPPKPISKWSQCGLNCKVLDILTRKCKYDKPTPIQSQAIPAIMSGRDVIAVAKTGSGKTMAFLLPMFRHILDQPPLGIMEGPISIIMTPTRELAVQIFLECRKFTNSLNLRVVCAYGGSPIKDNIADLKRGAEIIVCTPGRMIDLLCANSGRVTNLKRVTYVVLDEADRMFDMGFEPQVTKIIKNIRPDKQTVLFSATFPRQMETLARSVLKYQPLEIIVGGKSVVCSDVEQQIITFNELLMEKGGGSSSTLFAGSNNNAQDSEEEAKFLKLLQVLGQWYESKTKRILIFVDRQDAADNLLKDLLKRGYPCMSLHGGKDQSDRDSTLHDFKNGVVSILIATSVASRGLDVKDLDLVINYDCPNHLEDYVHRVGRTGRAGRKGTAITFITPSQERFAPDIIKALKQSNVAIPTDLEELSNRFLEKVKAGSATHSGRGFGGRGLEKMEKEREFMKRVQKQSYLGQDDDSSDDEELVEVDGEFLVIRKKTSELEEKIDKELDKSILTTSSNLATITEAVETQNTTNNTNESNTTVTDADTNEPTASTTAKSAPEDLNEVAMVAKCKEMIKLISQRIQEQILATEGAAGVEGVVTAGSEQEMRERQQNELLANLNAANKLPPQMVSCEIEINDFPQYARWKVTNRDSVNTIYELSKAAITVRGTFIPPNRATSILAADPTARKLYLFVEAESDLNLDRAKNEIKRILKEATFEAAERGHLDPNKGIGGKYTI